MQIRILSKNASIPNIFAKIGVHPVGIEILKRKSEIYRIYISGIKSVCANIIKQEMLAAGGDAAIPMEAITGNEGTCDIVLLGTEKNLKIFMEKLKKQPFNLGEVSEKISDVMACYHPPLQWKTAKRTLSLEKPLIMGILNITPDSFADGGKYMQRDAAIEHAREMVREGADIIDVGAESTRPESRRISAEEEIKRLSPVIEEVAGLGKPVSIDTYKPEVAEFALEHGAEIVNDIFGLRKEGMVKVVKEYGAGICIMHMQGEPETMQQNPTYQDLIGEIYSFLEERRDFAIANGIEKEKIVVDPGIGFGKTLEQNYEILARLDEFLSLGCPILIGASRKSFIGKVLDVPPEERVYGTVAMNTVALMNCAKILRVHDIKPHHHLVKLFSQFYYQLK
ncbi:MAG: dihydropteroate synthase [Thermoplasmata archaeon]